MKGKNLLPYGTIVKAVNGDPGAIETVSNVHAEKNKYNISDVKHRFGMNDRDKSVVHVKPVFLCRQKSECADVGWVDDINY